MSNTLRPEDVRFQIPDAPAPGQSVADAHRKLVDILTAPSLILQYSGPMQPPAGAIRAFGARLIAREVEAGGSGQVYDRVDTQPEEPRLSDPACPAGKRAFAKWVTDKGFPFLQAHVKRSGLPEAVIAMSDGVYAVQATTNGRHSGYVYVAMFEMPEGVAPPVTETPIPPPHPSTLPHEYVESTDRWMARYKNKPCEVCSRAKGFKLHKAKKVAGQ